MNSNYKYITVENPNGPPKDIAGIPFAQLVDIPLDDYDGAAQVTAHDMYLPNFSMRISKGVFEYDAMLLNTSANGIELLGSCLFPQGKLKSHLHNETSRIESFSGTQNFKYDPMNEIRHRIAAHTPFHIIHFSVNPEHFFQFLPDDENWSELLKAKIRNNERVIGPRSTPILLAQERALQIILDCPLTGKLGEIMIETSITQIMLLQLHSLFQKENDALQRTVSKRDVDIVQSLKEYLSKTFLEDHKLDNLARHFGTNTNKLMQLFKQTFGRSIFDYLGELKMEHAHTLLQDDEKMVVEVARIVGYKNPHHFSTAFKKKFGICPSQVR
jgi:AraC-like DNA-binding protein